MPCVTLKAGTPNAFTPTIHRFFHGPFSGSRTSPSINCGITATLPIPGTIRPRRRQFGSALRDLFVRLDRAIADLISLMPAETTVLVMSDHGFGPQHHTVNLNQFFIRAGLMTLRGGWRVRGRQWLFNRPLGVALGGSVAATVAFADVDWTRTVAYSLGHIGQVYLNVRGRQPYGASSQNCMRRCGQR
jgi:predicted AlkP superfamily phosphohydrolase/phosphomutase